MFSFFKKTARLFPKVVVPFYIPTTCVGGFLLLLILASIGDVNLFNINYSDGYAGISLWFIFYLPNEKGI